MTVHRKATASAALDRDPVVREVRAARVKLLREFGGDYDALSSAAKAYAESLGARWAPAPKTKAATKQRRRAS